MSLAVLGNYQQGVLRLAPELTVRTLEGQRLDTLTLDIRHLVIDASTLLHCDSIGVAALLWLLQQTGQKNIGLSWRNLPPVLTDLLDLYELDLTGITKLCRKN